ncbi:MAG TPA: hypothetical protein ENK23_05965 [Sorangium sp.]|nr:hypothetical protein [Sorangium sp.]
MNALPREERLRWMLGSAARLISGGAEPVSGLVLPNAKFFPDHFDKSDKAVARLMQRIAKIAGLSDLKIAVRIVRSEDAGGGGCASGACGIGGSSDEKRPRVERHGDGWAVNVAASETGNPTMLTTGMVRAISHIFLTEAELYDGVDPREAEGAVDLCGVLLGFGVLLCNGAYIYAKG